MAKNKVEIYFKVDGVLEVTFEDHEMDAINSDKIGWASTVLSEASDSELFNAMSHNNNFNVNDFLDETPEVDDVVTVK